jgi:diguanylate cyclase (GGDEF)-like protein
MSISERRSIARGGLSADPVALSNFLISHLQRQGLSANTLPARQSDWDWFLRSVDRAFTDISALEVQSNRATVMAEEELSALQKTFKLQQQELLDAQQNAQLSKHSLDIAGLGLFVFDAQTSNLSVDAGLARMLRLEQASAEISIATFRNSIEEKDQKLLLSSLAKASLSGEQIEMEFRTLSAGIEEKWFSLRLTPYTQAGAITRKVLGVALDITRVRKAELKATSLASFDQLTRVCNRQHFFALCRDKMAAPGSAEEPFALLYLDLDGFKKINESHGSKAGDQLLQLIAMRITSCMPDLNCVARYAADEFLIMVKNACDVRHIQSLVDSLLTSINKPVSLEVSDVSISASIGVSFFPAHGNTLDRLLQSADTALNKAKSSGRNSWTVFDESINSQVSARFAMINRLRSAIANNQLDLAFQPLVDGDTKTIQSVEALARWYDAELGPVSPSIFIPLAESCGLIESIGQFVLRQALKTIKQWDSEGGNPISLSVNFSAIQFSNPNFVEMIRDVLEEHRLPANRLQVEITESMMLDDIETCSIKLQALRRLGVSIALDDFGTGYSSLAYLESLPIDCVKIDRSFVSKIIDLNQRAPMIEAVIAIAKSLRMDVLAEGVETEVQRLTLLKMGCKKMQGYYYHRPMSAHKTGELLLGKSFEKEPARQALTIN